MEEWECCACGGHGIIGKNDRNTDDRIRETLRNRPMRRLFVSSTSTELGVLRSLLDSASIEYVVHDEVSHESFPGAAFYPELWIVHDGDFAKAAGIRDAWRSEPPRQGRWKCRDCGEELEGQFLSCLNCGAIHSSGLWLSRSSSLHPQAPLPPPNQLQTRRVVYSGGDNSLFELGISLSSQSRPRHPDTHPRPLDRPRRS